MKVLLWIGLMLMVSGIWLYFWFLPSGEETERDFGNFSTDTAAELDRHHWPLRGCVADICCSSRMESGDNTEDDLELPTSLRFQDHSLWELYDYRRLEREKVPSSFLPNISSEGMLHPSRPPNRFNRGNHS